MPDTLANTFILALDPVRNQLYALALAKESTPAKAEAALQRTVRTLFPEYAKDQFVDLPAEVEKALGPPPSTPPAPPAAMPADVWARLAAAVQLAAARTTPTAGATALNPDSVLLSPDPLLAPKKQMPPDDDDLSSPSHFLFSATIAILIGVALTIYILTRPSNPRPAPAITRPITTQAAPHE